jgi:hypothetical protein
MKLFRKLLGMGLLAASIAYVRGRRRARGAAPEAEVRFDDLVGTSAPSNENLVQVATPPVRDVEAQESVKELREGMPR